jgi:hypothetical protein
MFLLQASEYNLNLFLLLTRNTKSVVYIVNAEAEVNKSQHKSLLTLPVKILNILFCIVKIFEICEVPQKH